jgi:CoA:oxalate CoA-transferase
VYYGSGHPARRGNRSATACPHNIFATRDGYVAISADDDAMWARLAALAGTPELKSDASLATLDARLRSVDEVEAVIGAWTAEQTADTASRACQGAGVAAAPVRKLEDIVKDPDVAARRLIVEVNHPLGGRMKLLGNPLRFSATPAGVDSAAPVLGEHTEEVLRNWLHLSPESIETLAKSAVIVVAGTGIGQSQAAAASEVNV